MSGGGGSRLTTQTPWSAASPYLTSIMGDASQLYGSQAGAFGSPASNFNYGNVTGAVGNAVNGNTPLGTLGTNLTAPTEAAITSQLSGRPNYSAVNSALDAADQQQWNQFYNQVVPSLNQRASFLGNPSGAIKDLNSAVAQIGQNQSLNAQQAYLDQYNRAQQQQLQAAGLGGTLASGATNSTLQGASLYPSIYQMPNQTLGDYASIVNGIAGKGGTESVSAQPGSAATAMNIIGGGIGLGALYNMLFGGNSNGNGGNGGNGGGGSNGLGSALINGGKSLYYNLSGGWSPDESILNSVADSNASSLDSLLGFNSAGGGAAGSETTAGLTPSVLSSSEEWLPSQFAGYSTGSGLAGTGAAAGMTNLTSGALTDAGVQSALADAAANGTGAMEAGLGTTAGGSGAGSGALAAAGPAALAAALFGGQYALFNKASQLTPADQVGNAQAELNRMNSTQGLADEAKYHQDLDPARIFDQIIMNSYDPKTGGWIPGSDVYKIGGAPRATMARNYF